MIGTTFGPYQVESLLGRGGMGEVHRARDREHGNRPVALKVLPEHLSGDPQYRARFRREAEHAARLSDPHIATIHRYGEIDGLLFLDMELVRGRELGTLVADGSMPPEQAVELVEQIAAALDCAHSAGLVHRDVKPSNVLVDEPGDGRTPHAVLIDFGIASATDPGSRTALTRTGAVVGTLAYMAPERFLGEPAGPPADVYSLACVLHELLTGRKPFPATGLEGQVAGHVLRPPPQPSALRPGLPTGLDAVVTTGMAKDPAARYRTAAALASAARAALDSAPHAAPPATVAPGAPTLRTPTAAPTVAEPARRPVRSARNRTWLAPAGAGVVLGGILLVLVLLAVTLGAGPAPGDAQGSQAAAPTTPAAPVAVAPSTGPITDRTFVGAASTTRPPNVAFLDATPVVLTSDSLQILDMATGTPLGTVPPNADSGGSTVVRHAGRSLLLASTFDNVLRTWDLGTGEALPTTFAGHTESISASAAGVVDGRVVVATSSYDNTTRLWDLDTGAPIGGGSISGAVSAQDTFGSRALAAMRFMPVGGRMALVGSGDEMIHVWDAATGAVIGTPIPDDFQYFNGLPVATVGGRTVAVAEDGNLLPRDRRRWTVHDLATGAQIGEVTITSSDTTSPAGVAEIGGRGVLLVGDGRDIVMFDLATGAEVGAPLTGHEAKVYGMTVAPAGDRSLLVTVSEDKSARVWDLTAWSGG